MSRIRENKITLNCSNEQKKDAERQADEKGLTVQNLLRTFLGWPVQKPGQRNDLVKPEKKQGRKRG